MTYEEYKEQEMNTLMWGDESELDELAKQYPEHASRAKQEADARRGGTYEEYKKSLAERPKHVLVRDQEGELVWMPEEQ